MTIVTIGQPGLFPWWGTFAKAQASDIVIHLDHVSWQKSGYLNRFLLEGAEGPRWCTLPLRRPPIGTPIIDVRIESPARWFERHQQMLSRVAPGAAPVATELLSHVYLKGTDNASDLAIASTEKSAEFLGLGTRFIRSSQMDPVGTSSAMILGMLRDVGADGYLFGPGRRGIAQHYLDIGLLQRNGIRVGIAGYPARPRVSILQNIAVRKHLALSERSITVEWLSK